MKTNKLPCDFCGYEVSIRQTVKTGDFRGRKACSICKSKFEGLVNNVPDTKRKLQKVEEWRDIPGYSGYYQASVFGDIRSVDRQVIHSKGGYRQLKGKVLKTKKNPQGYRTVCLSVRGKVKTFQVHQLVAVTFLGHIINNYTKVVDHIDGDRLNNNINNLRSVTQRFNTSTGRVKGGTSDYVGIRIDRGRVRAKLMIEGQHIDLGYFETELSASIAYQEARDKYLGDKTFYIENIKGLSNKEKKDYLLTGSHKQQSPKTKKIRKLAPKTAARRKKERKGYSEFFKKSIAGLKECPICQNCGATINTSYLPHWNICHILPKSKYKSVATEKANTLFLCAAKDGANDCHEKFDGAYSKMVKMPCFTLAVKKFKTFKDKVSENGKLKAIFEEKLK